MLFDIDFDHTLFLEYVEELHRHLFGSASFEDLMIDINQHHQKHHLVTLHLIKARSLFYHCYNEREKLGLSPIFDIIIGALTENTCGDKIKEHFVDFLSLTPEMARSAASSYEKKVFMKNLKSFMMYARKKKGLFHNRQD
ncbi:hypothetical protein [Paenibacillus polymyxa]|uniref:Uncharacterized protein n=1 Tax=Paenibacillus polymyxa (strain SC2) TaxID=886882 RepID=E3ELA2_PAEPS|nr:hypothetical protein [Paenibacillus polymyxa]ADO59934.1 hypothetical protein PPSC2_28505 [Paenibacillus polymyxa SC2]WPQ59844.1 hypothetical protein SKN87_26520 [Paenibacillus polymyxa]